ncbi:MAG: hypothetical protein QXN02_03925 [Ignisphaera sp.]
MVIEGKTIWIKSVALLLLLIAITTTTYINTQSVSGKLSIVLDGQDNEWGNITGWISPAGKGVCPIPTTSYTVWLCCNSTSYPRECQIMWKDDEGGAVDILYARIYTNSSGIYAFIKIKTSFDTNITITLGNIKITIKLNNNKDNPTVSVNLIYNNLNISGVGAIRKYDGGFGIEIGINYTLTGSRTLSLEAQRIGGKGVGNIDTDTKFCVGDVCSESLVVFLENVIVNAYINNNSNVPVPVPEPVFAIVSVVLLLVSVVLVKVRKNI